MRFRLAGLALVVSALMISRPVLANIPGSAFDEGVHSVTSGGKFGLSIGMDINDVRPTLEKHGNVRFSERYACSNSTEYERTECKGADTKEYYDVQIFFIGGVIEVFSAQSKVVRIEWWRHAFDP